MAGPSDRCSYSTRTAYSNGMEMLHQTEKTVRTLLTELQHCRVTDSADRPCFGGRDFNTLAEICVPFSAVNGVAGMRLAYCLVPYIWVCFWSFVFPVVYSFVLFSPAASSFLCPALLSPAAVPVLLRLAVLRALPAFRSCRVVCSDGDEPASQTGKRKRRAKRTERARTRQGLT